VDRNKLTQRLVVVALVLLATGLRAGYLVGAPKGRHFDHVDAQGYHWLAVNLLERGVFSMNTAPPFHPDNVRAPLYPLFLAAWYAIAGPAPGFVVLIHVLLDALTVAVLYRLGRLLAGRRVGGGAAFLYAVNPSSWRFCNELLTEILFGLLLTTAVWMLVRYIKTGRNRDAVRCGVAFGLAILCKPNVQFLPLVLLALLVDALARGRKTWWQGVGIVLGVVLAMLLPWVVRNRVVFGEWFYTRTFDDNLAHVSAVSTLAEVRGERVAPWSERWEELYGEIIVTAALRYGWEDVDDAELSARERDQRLQNLASVGREIVLDHPLEFALSHTRAWLHSFIPQEHRFWYGYLTGVPWETLPVEGDALGRALRAARDGTLGDGLRLLLEERVLALPPLALALWLGWALAYAVAAVLFAIGVLRLRPWIVAFFIVATVFYVTFVPGQITQIRFRLPVMPLILLCVAVGLLGQPAPRTKLATVAP
jgi:4-amino-4-deoxy-L-arabinose transferase-like glycosyltransferase